MTKTITITAHWVAEKMPDVDTDVLIFDDEDPTGQVGAYIGDDDDGTNWVDAHGMPVSRVTHWAEMPSMATAAPQRGSNIEATIFHGAGAYAQCGYCSRYSDDPKALSKRPPTCDCGEMHGWSGSFVTPGPDAKWSAHNKVEA